MADFEDATSPTWAQPDRGPGQSEGPLGRHARLHRPGERQGLRAERQARGADGAPARLAPAGRARRASTARRCRGSLFDFGLYFFHNAKARSLARAPGPISTCPRWRATSRRGCGTTSSCFAQEALGSPSGTIKATVLIETLPAAFEMDEILYELRDHIAGLNCGRWDYIFSYIKRLRPPARGPDARPGGDGHGRGLPARLFPEADPDLPPPRRLRHGRHGGADPGQGRRRRPTRRPSPRCAPTRSARPATATTAPGSRTRTWCRWPWRSSTG